MFHFETPNVFTLGVHVFPKCNKRSVSLWNASHVSFWNTQTCFIGNTNVSPWKLSMFQGEHVTRSVLHMFQKCNKESVSKCVQMWNACFYSVCTDTGCDNTHIKCQLFTRVLKYLSHRVIYMVQQLGEKHVPYTPRDSCSMTECMSNVWPLRAHSKLELNNLCTLSGRKMQLIRCIMILNSCEYQLFEGYMSRIARKPTKWHMRKVSTGSA